jgi:hypothetical protein
MLMSASLAGIEVPIRAIDEATAVFRKVSDEAQKSMGQVEEATRKVEYTHQQMTAGMKGVVTGFSGVATSVFALYGAYDRLEDMQVSISRANLQVQSSLNMAEDAQRRYNATVEKYGIESEQAVAASKDLQLAQERYQVAVERAEMMQGNLNEAMVQSALSVIPTAITMINGLVQVKQSWAAAQAALNMVMNANPIMLIVTAVGALIAVLVVAYNTCEPFRNAVNQVGETLMNIFKPAIDAVGNALNWLWTNIVEPFINGLRWLADSLASVAGWFGSLGQSAASSQAAIDSETASLMGLYQTVGKPPSTGLIESFEYLDKVMKGIETPELTGSPVVGSVGGAVPFGVSSHVGMPVTVNINSPLVNIEGSADEKTAEMAAEKVRDELRNVLVEASSGSAPNTHKRVRVGGLLNVA